MQSSIIYNKVIKVVPRLLVFNRNDYSNIKSKLIKNSAQKNEKNMKMKLIHLQRKK